MQHISQLQELSGQQQNAFYNEYNNQQKSYTVAFLLCLFFGGFGIHKFYLNQNGKGLIYLLLSWTFIPGILALINLFTMAGEVERINDKIAQRIISRFI